MPACPRWAPWPTTRAFTGGSGQMVLVTGTVPHAEGMDPDAYTERYGGATALGIVPARRV